MPYTRELEFMKKTFEKCELQTLIIDQTEPASRQIDMGLRQTLGMEDYYARAAEMMFGYVEERTIYRLADSFGCRYLFFALPGGADKRIVAVGPYLVSELSHEQLMEQAEQHGINPQWFRVMEKYFANIPVLSEDNSVFAVLDTFAEQIWGKDGFRVADMGMESQPEVIHALQEDPPDPQETSWVIEELERRYAKENEILQAVSRGQMHKAELVMAGFSPLSFEKRLADPVRNLKNYCITMNTLLRKAAEKGGVHPLYLDRLSSSYVQRIESMSAVNVLQGSIEAMFRDYCRLVNKNATGHYLPPVQKAIMHIDMNLSGKLNLKTLAENQNINASYLSALFKKETGMTLTDYINQNRMRQAAQLLTDTKLQVQTVAQYCGFSDVNYFSKLFKKHTGQTPNDYRKGRQMVQR